MTMEHGYIVPSDQQDTVRTTTERTPIPPNPDMWVMRRDVFERNEARLAAAEKLAQAVEDFMPFLPQGYAGIPLSNVRIALEHWREVQK